MKKKLQITEDLRNRKVDELVADGYMFLVNHSGGKDSQKMLLKVLESGVPKSHIVVIHADLGRFEWGESTGTVSSLEHARKWTEHHGLSLTVVKSKLDLFEMCRKYHRWPAKRERFCTSGLKNQPISQWIKNESGFMKVVSCIGIRREESPDRAKGLDKACYDVSHIARTLDIDAKMSTNGRIGYTWYPIFEETTEEVFDGIHNAGEEPHPAYAQFGMSRLSCVFCVFASKPDLQIAAERAPELLKEYVELEKEIGKTVVAYKRVAGITFVPLDQHIASPKKRKSDKEVWTYKNSERKWVGAA